MKTIKSRGEQSTSNKVVLSVGEYDGLKLSISTNPHIWNEAYINDEIAGMIVSVLNDYMVEVSDDKSCERFTRSR